MTSDELSAQRDKLIAAIGSGMQEVRFGERWVKYQTTADMQKALSELNNQIAAANSTTTTRSMCNFTQFNG